MTQQFDIEHSKKTIAELLNFSDKIRYVAIYVDNQLISVQREDKEMKNASTSESDQYEELLVNPTLLKLASQRGNIDCGGLAYILIRYGNFYQLIHKTTRGHISICLELNADLNSLPQRIFSHLNLSLL